MLTPEKIRQFIEGNIKMLGVRLNLLPNHEKEQVLWRTIICKNDCLKEGVCKYCGCSLPGKLYVNKSCNGGERFPDMMDVEEWDEFKIKNNIDLGL